MGHDRARSDHGTFTDRDAFQDHAPRADPDVVRDRYRRERFDQGFLVPRVPQPVRIAVTDNDVTGDRAAGTDRHALAHVQLAALIDERPIADREHCSPPRSAHDEDLHSLKADPIADLDPGVRSNEPHTPGDDETRSGAIQPPA